MSDNNSSPPPPSPPRPALPRPTSFTPPPRRPPPPPMGIPGVSAFHHFNHPPRRPDPTLSWPTMHALFYLPHPPPPPPAAALVPVMGGGSHGSVPPLMLPLQETLKRGEGSGGNDKMLKCSVCGRGFRTDKALFGHMRSHPERQWRGAHPPPVFSAEQEFADIRNIMAVAAGQMEEEEERGEDQDQGEDRGDGGGGRLPDLNGPPPPEF